MVRHNAASSQSTWCHVPCMKAGVTAEGAATQVASQFMSSFHIINASCGRNSCISTLCRAQSHLGQYIIWLQEHEEEGHVPCV